jgi:hypothetical protein
LNDIVPELLPETDEDMIGVFVSWEGFDTFVYVELPAAIPYIF